MLFYVSMFLSAKKRFLKVNSFLKQTNTHILYIIIVVKMSQIPIWYYLCHLVKPK